MAWNLAIGAVVAALRVGPTAARVIRIGSKVFKKLDSDDPSHVLVPYIDVARLNASTAHCAKEFRALGNSQDKSVVAHMRREAGNVAGALASITPPIQGGSALSNKAIESDIKSIFSPLETIPFGELVMANQYSVLNSYNINFRSGAINNAIANKNWELVYEAFSRNNWRPYPEDVVAVPAPTRTLHKSAIYNGKPSRKFHVTGNKKIAQAKIDSYVQEVKSSIGKMAGGWVKCYVALGGKDYNLPLALSSRGSGKYSVAGSSKNPSVMIENKLGNFNNYLSKRKDVVFAKVNKHHRKLLTHIAGDINKEIIKRKMKR
jgi:hypothetical protein